MYPYKSYEHHVHEADEHEREKKTFHKPFQANVLEGGSLLPHHEDVEMVAILSSN